MTCCGIRAELSPLYSRDKPSAAGIRPGTAKCLLPSQSTARKSLLVHRSGGRRIASCVVIGSVLVSRLPASEQEGVPQSRSSTYAFSVRNISSTYHVFVDFKKAFDRVWHAALWATMKKYNISTNLIQVIKNLYNKATSAVLFNGSIGDWFRTTIGVRQGCLLSPTLFNIFLERIMTDALEDHEGTVSIRGREIISLRFVDDVDGLAEEEE